MFCSEHFISSLPNLFTNDSSSPPTYYLSSLPIYLTLLSPKYHSYVHAPIPIPCVFLFVFYLSRNESIRFGYKYDLDCFATDFFWFRPALLPLLHCIVLHIIPPHGPAFVTSPSPLLPLIPIPILILWSAFCIWWCLANFCRTVVHSSSYRLSILFVDTLSTL